MTAACFNARGDAPNCKTVALIVVGRWVDVGGIELEVVGVGGSVDRRRPVVAPSADIVEGAIVEVAATLTKGRCRYESGKTWQNQVMADGKFQR